ncbi:MAG: ATP-binding protein [Nostoc sp. ChiQUE02]|uniref:ATP-binding protein n=1 Tax=Nostoc sp. ChiQUE02 TaxID=3075377 RepID=UPI002AD2656D|nr:ATP-binding protein [Nostoc sp. ChiQUE02]MDZ8233517.1 ATP-binding protein [Nostoc sp. ChiQUE02]
MKYEILRDQKDPKYDLDSLVIKPKWSLDEIALSSEILEQIEQIVAYIKYREILLNKWQYCRFLKTGKGLTINFFGLPGTGKSITAEAIAQKLGMNIIKVNYGELESELVGGTSKNLSNIFQVAEKSGSLLLFDEADTVLSKRISNLSQAADYGINSAKGTLLTLLDKFNGVIIFTTNLFENYDGAFLRRIIFNIEFDPPNFLTRIQLWRFHLSETVPKTISYEKAAEISDSLCGGDIRNIAIKLGLKLLANQVSLIDENLMLETIQKYKDIKEIHKKTEFMQKYVLESNSVSNSSQLEN